MPPTLQQAQKGYAKLWDEATVTKHNEAALMADRIIANKAHYLSVERKIGVPWIMVATIHMRESSLNFRAHMHNGDPLTGYTYQVPAGRPKVGHGPPFTFEESTSDAFTMPGKAFDKLAGQWCIELMSFSTEGYNGWGYLNKGNTPYLYSWTSVYHGGKYVADHQYDPNVWDKQPGCVAIWKALAEKDESARAWCERRTGATQPPAVAVKQQTRKERGAAQAGGAGAVAGGTGTAVPKPDNPAAKTGITFASAIGLVIGLAIVVVAGMLLYRKTKMLKERWAGSPAV